MFIINNTLTFISTYTKSRNIHGITRQVAHCPSFRVSRLLLLVLSSVYPAAAHLAAMCLMAKEHAENYLTHVFVQSGQIMKTSDFSKALSSFTQHILDRPMGMRDWRQVMCSIMLNIGHIDFHLPDDDDEDLKMIHQLFSHSIETGEQHYALQINDALPGFSHTSIASDQRVCFRWHACINQLHPSLMKEIKDANMVLEFIFLNLHCSYFLFIRIKMQNLEKITFLSLMHVLDQCLMISKFNCSKTLKKL